MPLELCMVTIYFNAHLNLLFRFLKYYVLKILFVLLTAGVPHPTSLISSRDHDLGQKMTSW